jgi:hypothetical protein
MSGACPRQDLLKRKFFALSSALHPREPAVACEGLLHISISLSGLLSSRKAPLIIISTELE